MKFWDQSPRVASFFPFHATYWLNGHSFMEREMKRAGMAFARMTTPLLPWAMWRLCKRPPID